MTDEIRLKPCPFCGSNKVYIEDNSPEDEPNTDWILQCDGCGTAFIASNDGMPCTRGQLAGRWNRRTAPAAETRGGDPVFYWPRAITRDGQELWTYDSFLTINEALKVFTNWEVGYDYQIKEAWIDTTDGRRVDCHHPEAWVAEMPSLNEGSDDDAHQ